MPASSRFSLPFSGLLHQDNYATIAHDASNPTFRLRELTRLAQTKGVQLCKGRNPALWTSFFVQEQSKKSFGEIGGRLLWRIALELETLHALAQTQVVKGEATVEKGRVRTSAGLLLDAELTQTLTQLACTGQQVNDFGASGGLEKAVSEASTQMAVLLIGLNAPQTLNTPVLKSLPEHPLLYKDFMLQRAARSVTQEAVRQGALDESSLRECLKNLWVKESETLLRVALKKHAIEPLGPDFFSTLIDSVLIDRYDARTLKNWKSAPKAAATLIQRIKSLEGGMAQDSIERYSQMAVFARDKEQEALKNIDFLVEQGLFTANPPATKEGTLLMGAIKGKRPELARRLLNLGADTSATDLEGVSALDCARAMRHLKGREEQELYTLFEPHLKAHQERQDLEQDAQAQLIALGRACQTWLKTQSLFDASGVALSQDRLIAEACARVAPTTSGPKKRTQRL